MYVSHYIYLVRVFLSFEKNNNFLTIMYSVVVSQLGYAALLIEDTQYGSSLFHKCIIRSDSHVHLVVHQRITVRQL